MAVCPAVDVRRVVVKTDVIASADVHISIQTTERVKRVERAQVDVLPIPRLRLPGSVRAVAKRVPIRCVGRLRRALAGLVALRSLDVVHVAIGKISLVEIVALHRLQRKVEAPHIAVELRRACLCRVVDDAPMHVVRPQRRQSADFKHPVRQRFLHTSRAAMDGAPRAGVCVERHGVPRLVILAPVVLYPDVACAIKKQRPLVFPAHIDGALPAVLELDVIIHFTVIDECCGEPHIVERVVVLRVIHVRVVRDEMPRLELRDRRRRERLHRPASTARSRLKRPAPRRHAVVNKVREVRLLIVRVRHSHAAAKCVGGGNAIPHKAAMRLRGGGDRRRKNTVARDCVAVCAAIVHRHARPACCVGRVGFPDVTSGNYSLRLQRHRRHAVCIRDARSDHHGLPRERKIRRVRDIANCRRCNARKCRVCRTRSLRQRHFRGTAPRTAEVVFQRRMNQLNARSRARCGSRPRKTFREIHVVHFHICSVAQLDRLTGFLQLANPLSERRNPISRLKHRAIRSDDHVAARRNRRRRREQKIHRIHKPPASHVHRGRRRIPQLDKLAVLRPVARLVKDFVDDDRRFRRRRKTQRRGPGRARCVGRSRPEKVRRRRREIVRQSSER